MNLDLQERDERQQALRALLARPLLSAPGDAEALALVRRHRIWLADWLLRHAGWGLTLDAEVARLHRTPGDPLDPSHPARDPRHHQSFTRRRYVLWCLALAHLEGAGRQTTLRRLADHLGRQMAADPVLEAAGMTWDPLRREHRADLVAVGRLLQHWAVLAQRQGDEDAFLAGETQTGDALYTIHRPALVRLLAVRQGPSLMPACDPAALQAEPPPASDEDQRRHLRRRLVRHLLEKAVLHVADLDEPSRAYWKNQGPSLIALVAEATGLEPEIRAEGVALIDRDGTLCDLPLGAEGTEGHAALLLANFLSAELRAGRTLVPRASIERFLAQAAEDHGSRWRRESRSIEGLDALGARLLERFAAGDLIRSEAEGIRPLAILARWGTPDIPPPVAVQQSLFP